MLVLSRKVGEEIVIDGEIRVSIVRVRWESRAAGNPSACGRQHSAAGHSTASRKSCVGSTGAALLADSGRPVSRR